MRRVVTLIQQVAISTDMEASLQGQTESANQSAKKYQEDNLRLRQVREGERERGREGEGLRLS